MEAKPSPATPLKARARVHESAVHVAQPIVATKKAKMPKTTGHFSCLNFVESSLESAMVRKTSPLTKGDQRCDDHDAGEERQESGRLLHRRDICEPQAVDFP